MKKEFLILCIILSSVCMQSLSQTEQAEIYNTLKTIDIILMVNKEDKSIEWSLRYNSNDKDQLELSVPDMSGSLSSFVLYDDSLNTIGSRCLFINRKVLDMDWLILPANSWVKVKLPYTLIQFFCHIKSGYYLAYIYLSNYKIKKNNKFTASGYFAFEIPPTQISKVDTVSLKKIIY